MTQTLPISREEIRNRIKEILVDALCVDEAEVQPQATLTMDLGAESIDILDIEFRLGKVFGKGLGHRFEIPQDVLTVAHLEEYIARRLGV